MKLIVEDVIKNFGEKQVIKGISFSLEAGDCLAIIGESGCGKSTLIKIIAGLLNQTSGSVKITKDGEVFLPNIGYAFQLNALFDSYTIWQNIAFKAYIENSMPKNTIIRKVYETLKLVNLNASVARLHPKDLSGGMQKRVAIARAIFNNPDIIFLDEPTSGLDPYTSAKIVETINDLKTPDGKTPIKIAIVHDIKVTKAISNKVLFMNDGKIGWFGRTANIENECNDNPDLHRFVSHI